MHACLGERQHGACFVRPEGAASRQHERQRTGERVGARSSAIQPSVQLLLGERVGTCLDSTVVKNRMGAAWIP